MKNITIIIISLLLGGCVTQQKCQEKFPAKELTRDTAKILVRDTIYKDLEFWTGGSSIDWQGGDFDPFEFLPRDTVIVRTNDTVTLTIEKKAGATSVNCKTEPLLVKIQDLEIEVEYLQEVINVTEQFYFDQKAEIKKLKIEHREAVQKAKAKKLMWLFLIIALLVGATFVHRYVRS